jgi:ABC-type phosphate/phosphonate transport system substrate-binding protein
MFQNIKLLFFLLIALSLMACDAIPASSPPTPLSTATVEVTSDEVKVGVLAIRSGVAAQSQYGALMAYLEETIGRPFTLVPVTQESQFTLVEEGALDFTFNNPLAAVQIRRLYGTQFLATLSRPNTGTQFSGLIIVRDDSQMTTLDDLAGKRATCVAFETAAAGCIFQVYHLQQNGIDPFTDLSSFTETPSQDNIVLSVLNGTVDAGFIRTGQLERMKADGMLLGLEELRILDQADDEFFYPHTTRLYPEWPFAALAGTDPELAKALQSALLNIPSDHPAMVKAKATSFVSALDYTSLDELIEGLQLRSSNGQGKEAKGKK